MKVQTEKNGDVYILNLTGELDSRGNLQLDKVIKDLAKEKCYRLILDLSLIRFVGSQTVSMLISNLKEIRAGGGNIKFLNPQRPVIQYLKQNKITEIFDIYSNKGDAIQSYQTGTPFVAPGSKPGYSPDSHAEEGAQPAVQHLSQHLHVNEILYANSCLLATLVKTLENKGLLSSQEAGELLSYETSPKKGSGP